MKQRITGIAFLSLITGLASVGSLAANPGSFITTAGKPALWKNTQSILYNIDQGALGKLSNAKAARIVADAFDQWQNIDTANLQFEESDPLDRDVSGANISDFMNGLPSDVNPVIFDQDGGVLDAFFGGGASESVLAFGSPLSQSVTPTGTIAQGIIIINGRMTDGLFDPDDPGADEMERAIVRAVGSFLNLGASDANDELLFDGNVANNTAIPVMYPSSVIGGGFTPTLDDRMAISALYPAANLDTKTGIIRGQMLLADGTTALQGIAIDAIDSSNPTNVIQAISGATFVNTSRRGSRDLAQRGTFEMRVPVGTYIVQFRPLRQNIGPLAQVFPLPGGAQFYQASASPTAGPDPTSATPVTVTAGQPTELKLVAGGTPAPAPQQIAEVEPNDAAIEAQLLPNAAVVTGNVSPNDTAQVVLDAGGGSRDKIEDLYRIVVTERSVLSLHMQPKDKVDLDLYLFNGLPGGAASAITGSLFDGTEAEALQVDVGPGTYYIGVTAWDGVTNPTATDYTLTLTASPEGDQTPRARPQLNQFVVGDVTATSAEARWITDGDATADVIVSIPRQQFGDPTAAKTHKVALTGLTSEAYNNLTAISQLPGASRDSIPGVFFRTANKTPIDGAAKLNAAMVGQFEDFINIDGTETGTLLSAVAIRNTGGSATNVQLTALTVPAGWKLAVPVTDPINVGRIDSGGTAVVVVRLLRDGTGTAPVATVTGTGTATAADGSAVNFTVGP